MFAIFVVDCHLGIEKLNFFIGIFFISKQNTCRIWEHANIPKLWNAGCIIKNIPNTDSTKYCDIFTSFQIPKKEMVVGTFHILSQKKCQKNHKL